MPCRVVCVSYATGSGGDEVGRLVADRLGFLHVDEEIVARAAAKGGLSSADVADEERRKSLAARILGVISESGSAASLGGPAPFLLEEGASSSEIRILIRETIEQTAARGDVVITAHAASHALEPGPSVLRVFVTASPKTRAQRVSEDTGGATGAAERTVKAADAARRDYLKRFYDVADELPTQYDLVVNTDAISVEEAAELVAHVAAARSPFAAPT